MARHNEQFIIGIDEAGRGPLAGPVVVGGVKINSKFKTQNSKFWSDFRNIKDSKKLSAKQREAWFAKLTAYPEIAWAVARVYPKTIDRINISRAANLGARRVYRKLSVGSSRVVGNGRIGNSQSGQSSLSSLKKFFTLNATAYRIVTFLKRDFLKRDLRSDFDDVMETVALLDGGLRLPAHIPHQAIIRGDEKIPVIAAASIIAKVTRDRLMARLHQKYPRYRFDVHKGYGTVLHRALLKKYGRSEAHRKSFRFSPARFATRSNATLS